MGRYALEGGPQPDELVDVAIAERFGWTFDQLDEQDLTRLMPDLYADSIAASLGRVNAFLDSVGKLQPTTRDWVNYKVAIDAMAECPVIVRD